MTSHWISCLIAGSYAFAAANAGAAIVAAGGDKDLIERGRYVAIAGDCLACHTTAGGKPFAGGLILPTPIGKIISTNITPSTTAGIGNYTLEQFTLALRRGIRADGRRLYPAMPYTSYALVNDADVQALYAYFMQRVAPVDDPSTPTHLPFPFNIRLTMMAWNLLFLDSKPFIPDPNRSAQWNRGAYLVRGLEHCGVCHSPRNLLMAEKSSAALAGALLGTWVAPNITSDLNSGIGGWVTQDIVDYLRTGHAVNKAQAAGGMAEAVDNSLQHLAGQDLQAMATYLKTVPARHDSADTRAVYNWGAAADELDAIRGVPLPVDGNAMSGAQLYDAYCATCHQSRGEGSFDGGLPSLFHNTATGRSQNNNLVMVILEGIEWRSNGIDVHMPGFSSTLSDAQVAALSTYLTQHFGNPAVEVTAEQVKMLRAGGTTLNLVWPVRLVLVMLALMVVAIFGLWVRRRRPNERASKAS